tara:strand:- start:240 stop:572 length:333 start_codon:yes stop_codon:yes gene_type:complete
MEDRIIKATMRASGLSMDQLTSKKRDRDIVVPRQVAAYLLRLHTNYSLAHIGRVLNCNHATVMHSIKIVKCSIEIADCVVLEHLRRIKECMDLQKCNEVPVVDFFDYVTE